MLGLGGAFSIVLLIASHRLKVTVDPRVEQIYEVLPHVDCGACGYAGCSAYAKAVMANPELIGLCAPGGAETADKIAAVLNLQISNSGPAKRPIVHCRAKKEDKTFFAKCTGIATCTTANALSSVQACKFGCLGYGDCVQACKFDALHIIDGLATVDYEKCTGCGACVKACPRNIIKMVPFNYEPTMSVACSCKENGKTTRSICRVGCIGCGLCTKQSELFSVDDNLAQIDYAGYQGGEQAQAAMQKCPTKVIVYRGKSAPPDIAPPQRKQAAAKT